MRRGTQGKGIHRLKDGTLLGVNLGADFTAEHEWGIKRLRDLYEIDDTAEGIERRKIRHCPKEHILFDAVRLEKTTWWGLISFTYPLSRDEIRLLDRSTVGNCELTPYRIDEITGAWDERSFGFLTSDESIAREMHTALESLDLCIGLFNGEAWNPFSRSGLGLLIASRIPAEVQEQWLASDRDGRALTTASAGTGIADRLKKAGIRYYALSPKWTKDIRGKTTKTQHPVIYWLNPCEQDRNNYGWFTVEQLDQWIVGKGPIPKNGKAA
jgi:hypothetical protein